jgi:spermidine synthase
MRSTTPASRSDPATQPDVGRGRLPGGTGLTIPALLLFASVAAALVYQVLWIKQLSLVVGVDVYAVTTGVSAFFAGLALGGALFGRWADRAARPLLLYALLELGVAVLGVAGGRLYAANTAGAIAGALLAPFVLLPSLGVRGAAFSAAAVNLAGAVGALGFDRAVQPLEYGGRPGVPGV